MAYIHPLWSDPPTAENFRRGSELLQKAAPRQQATARERAYIGAAMAYHRPGQAASGRANLSAFADGWRSACRNAIHGTSSRPWKRSPGSRALGAAHLRAA